MSLNSTSCAAAINTAIDSLIDGYPAAGTFSADFAAAYKTYSQAGVLSSGGGVLGTEVDSIISSFMTSISNSPTTPHDFAVAIASYWDTCLKTPVAPAVSLTNNAMSLVSAFEAAINASYTTSSSTPYYQAFIQNIEDVAKTIVWTVVLSVPPFSRTETVS